MTGGRKRRVESVHWTCSGVQVGVRATGSVDVGQSVHALRDKRMRETHA